MAGLGIGVGRRGDYLRGQKKKAELNSVPTSPWRLFSFERKIPKNIIFITLCLDFSGHFMLWLTLQYLSYKANGGFMVQNRREKSAMLIHHLSMIDEHYPRR